MNMNKSGVVGVLAIAGIMFPDLAQAATDGDFSNEVSLVEKFLTGGYMRVGLLGVCGVSAIIGAVKQNWGIFASALGACFFALIMKGWVGSNFAAVI